MDPSLYLIKIQGNKKKKHEELSLTAIWLPNGQLWATVKWAASPTRCSSLHLYLVRSEGRWEPLSEVGSQTLTEHLMGFEPRAFDSQCNALC